MSNVYPRRAVDDRSFQSYLPKTWLCECFISDENANHSVSPIVVSAVTVIRDSLCNRRSVENSWRIRTCGNIQEYTWRNICINTECKIHQTPLAALFRQEWMRIYQECCFKCANSKLQFVAVTEPSNSQDSNGLLLFYYLCMNCGWPYAYPSEYFLSHCGKVELTSYIMAGNGVRLLAHIMELGADALSESSVVCEFNQHGFIRECRCTGNSKSPRICIDHHYANDVRKVTMLPPTPRDSQIRLLSTRFFDLTDSGLTPQSILALWE